MDKFFSIKFIIVCFPTSTTGTILFIMLYYSYFYLLIRLLLLLATKPIPPTSMCIMYHYAGPSHHKDTRMNSCGFKEGPIENAYAQGPEFCTTALVGLCRWSVVSLSHHGHGFIHSRFTTDITTS